MLIPAAGSAVALTARGFPDASTGPGRAAWMVRRTPPALPGRLRPGPEQTAAAQDHAIAQYNSTERISSMNPLLHRGKLLIVTMALAFSGLAVSVAAVQAAHAATLPAAAMSAQTQAGSQNHPPDPC